MWRGIILTDELTNVGPWEVAGEGRPFNSRVGRGDSLGLNRLDPKVIPRWPRANLDPKFREKIKMGFWNEHDEAIWKSHLLPSG